MAFLATLFRRDRRNVQRGGHRTSRHVASRSSLKRTLAAQCFELQAGFEPLEGRAMLALTLPGEATSYLQDFDGIGAGLPTGWTVRTGGSATSRGVAATFGTTAVDWSNNGGAFKNFASADGGASTDASAVQSGRADRALGVRQTGSFGDPGAAFELELANTTGRTGFTIDVANQMLSVQARSTTWSVQHSVDGTSWTTTGNFVDPGVFGSTTTTYNFGSALDNSDSPVFIRIAALSASTGGGSRDSYGIDDFVLSWTNLVEGAPAISQPGSLTPFATVAGTASPAQSFSVTGSNLTANITAAASAGFEVSANGTTYGSTATIAQAGGSASGSIFVRIAAGAAAGPVSGSVALTSGDANPVNVTVTGSVRPAVIPFPYGPETFEFTSEPWFKYDAGGSRNWEYLTTNRGNGQFSGQPANKVWEVNGFGSTELPNDWLLLGPFDLTDATRPAISFATLNAFTAGGTVVDELSLKVSSDFSGSGDPAAATWTTLPFAKPLAENTKTPAGQVALQGMGGQSRVYVGFQYVAGGTTNNTTALWQVDDVAVFDVVTPAINLVVPAAINEGTLDIEGVVSIPGPLDQDLVITVTSSDANVLRVDNGDFNGAATALVTIPAGATSGTFFIETIRDFQFGPDVPVTLSVSVADASLDPAMSVVTVRNVDPQAASFGEAGYAQNFSTFMAGADLPLGWSIAASGTDGSRLARSNWGTTTTGIKHSSETTSVFGYQHASSTGVVTQTLTLQNDTGSPITALTIGYIGRADRLGEARIPIYTVTVNGVAVQALAYGTNEGDGVAKRIAISDLSIPDGTSFQIVWTSDRGLSSGASRTIGISEVTVSAGVTQLTPSVANLAVAAASVTREGARVSASVTGDGGADVTARGFVFIASAALGEGMVLDLDNPAASRVDAGSGVGDFEQTLAGLSTGMAYTIRAFATNATGTAYSAPVTLQTVGPAASLTGVYQQPFDDFRGGLPQGWWAVSGGNALAYTGAWGTGQTAGFTGGQTDPGVLGYQHTATSGELAVTLSLLNDTSYTIDTLDVAYLGRVARAPELRHPAWTVSINGVIVPQLAYSTGNTAGENGAAADQSVSHRLENLGLAPGGELTITWVSTRDSGQAQGSSRQIGIGEVVVTAVVPATAVPVVALGTPAASLMTLSSTRLHGSVTATNGSVSAHGVVYALTSENPNPELGGQNVSFVELPAGGLAAFDFFADVTGLVAGANYSFKAYATNSLGTAYSPVGTWTTVAVADPPTVTTPTAAAVTATGATLGGTVADNGGALIDAHGVVIAVQSANPSPSLGDEGVIVVSVEQAISGAFALPVTGLAGSTTYAFRAFAINAAGTSYSEAGSFTTQAPAALPTTLAVGDLSVIGFNSNAPDGFAFVTWVDLAPNTRIKFTDNAFLSTGSANAPLNARGGEDFVTWTNTSGGTIPAGTVITIVDAAPAAGATASVGSTAQVLGLLSTSGDQIFAYQGTGAGTTTTNSDFAAVSNPTTFNGSLVFGLTYGADWLATGAPTSSQSYLPSELAGGSASIAITTGSTTRGQYTGARTGFASVAAAKTAVTNPANWTTATSTGVITLDATAFFLGEVVGTTTTLGSITPLTVDVGQSVTLSGTVEAASGTAAPTGTVQIRSGGPTGTLLASTIVTAGSGGSGSFSVTTADIPVGTYADVQAFFLASGGFGSSTSAVFADPLTIVSTAVATSVTLDNITPLSSTVGTTITFSGTVAAGVGATTPAGTIQIRSGGPTGTLVASTSTITGTGGAATYAIVVSNLPVGVYGTLQAFFVANPLFDASQSDYFLNAVTVRPTGVTPQFTRWTFEGDSLVPLIGSGTASVIGSVTSSFAAGTGSGRALSTAAFPALGAASGTAGARFMVSTVGRESISLSFDHRASSTASRWAQVDYTLDSGSTWIAGHWNNGGALPAEAFTTFTVDFSGVIGANNNPDFGVRIVSIFQPTTTAYQPAGTGSYGTSGTWRLDNVTFGGFAGATISTATGADYLRVVTYNIASSQDIGVPRSGLDTVLAAIGTEVVAGWSGPIDLLALQEVQSQNATTQLVVDSLNGIYGPGTYARGSVNAFSSGGGGTMGVVFNTGSLSLLEEVSIATGGPRYAMRYLFRPLAATASETFYVYVAHFKAGTDSQSVSTRAFEAAALRADADRLGTGASVLYVGDFNVYESSEVGYQALVGSGGTGQAFDPVNRPGNWSNSSSFRDVFTQSPAVTAAGGLIGGGLDDRFDFQLVSDAVLTGNGLRYQTGSYRAFGNNGTVPLNGAINNQANTALPDLANRTTVLNLLTTVSDHLPVVADYTVPAGAPLSALSTTVGTPSSAVSFNVRGSSLTGNLSVAAPVGFEISTSAGSGYTSNPLSLTAAAGVVNATVFIRLASVTAAGSYGGDISISGGSAATSTLAMPTSAVTGDPDPVAPVKVAGVYVRGSAWNASYLARSPFTTLDGSAIGWQLPDGANQLVNASNVSWNNVDVVSVRFDQPIAQPAAAALQLVLGTAGGNQMIVPSVSPTLLAGGTVAQWTLPAAIASGRYVISIASAGITNAAGTAVLDGEWTSSTSTFAEGSGDGTAGGIFNFFFNALVGDVNGNGSMNPTDISTIRSSLTSAFTTSLKLDNSDYRLDINGSNGLNSADLSQARAQLISAFGTGLASLQQVTAPVEQSVRSARGFASLADESGTNSQDPLSAEAWAWYALSVESETSKKKTQGQL